MTLVEVIWAATLLIAVFVIVPILWFYLHRAFRAARSIRHYFDEMQKAGAGIVTNTASIVALEDTIKVATTMLTVAGGIVEHTGTIKTVLADRAREGDNPVSPGSRFGKN